MEDVRDVRVEGCMVVKHVIPNVFGKHCNEDNWGRVINRMTVEEWIGSVLLKSYENRKEVRAINDCMPRSLSILWVDYNNGKNETEEYVFPTYELDALTLFPSGDMGPINMTFSANHDGNVLTWHVMFNGICRGVTNINLSIAWWLAVTKYLDVDSGSFWCYNGKEYFCDKLTIDDEYEHEIVKNMRRVTIDELSRHE